MDAVLPPDQLGAAGVTGVELPTLGGQSGPNSPKTGAIVSAGAGASAGS